MSQKVGAGYVEIEPRVSTKDLKELQKKIQTYLESKPVHIQVDVRQTELRKLRTKISEFLSRTFYLSVDVRNTTLTALREKIHAALALRTVWIDIDVRKADLLATRAKIEAALSGIDVNVGTDTRGGGGGRRGRDGRSLSGFGGAAAGGGLSTIANAFQLNGPVGGAVILALAGALAAAAVPLGAMLGGLIFSALGTAPLVGAILVGLQDPRVGKAFQGLKDKFTKLVTDPLKGEFGDVLLGIVDQFSAALERWAPLIQSILQAGMKFATPIANGVEDAIDIFLPGFDELINSKFIKRIMERLAGGFKIIADGFNEIFGDILNDPEAQAGFERGVTSFFNGVRILLVGVFDFLRWAGRTWESWNIPDASGVTTVDRFKELFSNLSDIIKTLATSIFHKENIDAALDSTNQILRFIDGIVNNEMVKELLGALGRVGGIGGQTSTGNGFWDGFIKSFKQALNPAEIFFTPEWDQLMANTRREWDTMVAWIKRTWESFTTWLSTSWETVKRWWNELVEWLKLQWNNFTTWITMKWNDFWAPFVTAWQNIKTGWNNLISGSFMGGWSNWDTWIKGKLANFASPFQVAWDNIKAGWNSLVGSLRSIWDGFFSWLTSKNNSVMSKVTKTPSKGATNVAGKRFGGLMMSGGGMAVGAGSGISDSIPAMISNGEFVVNAQATSQNLGLLNAINSGQSYQPNINVYVDGVAVAHRTVVNDAFRSVTGYLTAGRGD